MTVSHINSFRDNDRFYDQEIDTTTDATTILDATDAEEYEDRKLMMTVSCSGTVIFHETGEHVAGYMRMNVLNQWVFNPTEKCIIKEPFNTGKTYLIDGEIILFKTYLSQRKSV